MQAKLKRKSMMTAVMTNFRGGHAINGNELRLLHCRH